MNESELRVKYPFLVERVDRKGKLVWTAEVIDLPGAAAVGETLEDLVQEVDAVISEWLATAAELGMEVPPPSAEERFSGKITLRMDPSLHRLLSLAAKRHDLSLNSFIVGNLSFSAGRERR